VLMCLKWQNEVSYETPGNNGSQTSRTEKFPQVERVFGGSEPKIRDRGSQGVRSMRSSTPDHCRRWQRHSFDGV